MSDWSKRVLFLLTLHKWTTLMHGGKEGIIYNSSHCIKLLALKIQCHSHFMSHPTVPYLFGKYKMQKVNTIAASP